MSVVSCVWLSRPAGRRASALEWVDCSRLSGRATDDTHTHTHSEVRVILAGRHVGVVRVVLVWGRHAYPGGAFAGFAESALSSCKDLRSAVGWFHVCGI